MKKAENAKVDLENGVIAMIHHRTGNTDFYRNGRKCNIGSLTLRQLNLIQHTLSDLIK